MYTRSSFLNGFLFSLGGSLTGGTIAFLILQIAATQGFWPAMWYVVGDGLMELLIVGLLVYAFLKIGRSPAWMETLLRWSSLIFLILALVSFQAAFSEKSNDSNWIEKGMHPFWLGIVVRFLIPTLIPYWAGISALLIAENKLSLGRVYYDFMGGVTIGAIGAHAVYAIAGVFGRSLLELYQDWLYMAMGCVFLALAVTQFLRKSEKGIRRA